jgi:hypothetical protein
VIQPHEPFVVVVVVVVVVAICNLFVAVALKFENIFNCNVGIPAVAAVVAVVVDTKYDDDDE